MTKLERIIKHLGDGDKLLDLYRESVADGGGDYGKLLHAYALELGVTVQDVYQIVKVGFHGIKVGTEEWERVENEKAIMVLDEMRGDQ